MQGWIASKDLLEHLCEVGMKVLDCISGAGERSFGKKLEMV
jgi:hypothetical protein